MAKCFKFVSDMKARLNSQKINRLKMSPDRKDILLEDKNIKALNKFIAKANKELEPVYVKTLDYEEVARSILEEKLREFDRKQHWAYRAVDHSYMKANFKGKGSLKLVEEHDEKVRSLREKRADFVKKLEEEKNVYIATHKVSEEERDEAIKEYSRLKDEKQRELDELYDKLVITREELVKEKKDICDTKIKSLVEKNTDLDMPEDTVIDVKNLCMYFGGLHAVEDLSFDVKKGEIFGLIGPNGAGKTTVFNCITQFYKCTSGSIIYRNTTGQVVDLEKLQVHDVILEGISRTFQNVEVVFELTVLENLLIAATRKYHANMAEQVLRFNILTVDDKKLHQKAMSILNKLGISAYANWLCFGLPYGILKKIEIARALMADPNLLILDEPAAGLNDTETLELAKTIKEIREEFNCSILLVEHDMSLVMSICDRICAISFGKMLAIGTPEVVQANKDVQEAYLGKGDD